MKTKQNKLIVIIGFIVLLLNSLAIGSNSLEKEKREILERISVVQIPFIENKGQIKTDEVKFYAKTFAGTAFVTDKGEIIYALPKRAAIESKAKTTPVTPRSAENSQGWVIKEHFVGASISGIQGEKQATTRVNNFRGKDFTEWRKEVPTFNAVDLGEIYSGIRLKLNAYNNNVEKLFYVSPGSKAEAIQVKIEGGRGIKVNEKGELEVETGLGVIRFTRPIAYQKQGNKKRYVEVAYAVVEDTYSFHIDDYDRTKELVIDPLLASTFLGSSNADSEEYLAMAVDNSGNIYLSGHASSPSFPQQLVLTILVTMVIMTFLYRNLIARFKIS